MAGRRRHARTYFAQVIPRNFAAMPLSADSAGPSSPVANGLRRRTAIATLGQIGAPSDLPLIRAGLTAPNRSVQMVAEAALKAMERRK